MKFSSSDGHAEIDSVEAQNGTADVLRRAAIRAVRRRADSLIHLAEAAVARPKSSAVLSELAVRAVPRWHFAMLNDEARNDALISAVASVVSPDSLVLDIGAGCGLLAMAAARAGAKHIVACEENAFLAEVTRRTVEINGFADQINVLACRSDEIVVGSELSRPADVILSEVIGFGLIDEGLLPTLRHAREHLLAPSGVLVPQSARIFGQLISSPEAIGLNNVDRVAGFDFKVLNLAAVETHFPVRLGGTVSYRALSDSFEIVSFDFTHSDLTAGVAKCGVCVKTEGVADALAVWFEVEVGNHALLTNSPLAGRSHWEQAILPLPSSMRLGGDERVVLRVEWTDSALRVTDAQYSS